MDSHAALANVDILHEIFAHLALTYWQGLVLEDERPNRATLLSAAQCCKTFSSPALDMLWWKIDNICHLLRLLPAFHLLGRDYILDGGVTEQDWERFDSYARRVRYLVFLESGTIHPSVFLRLSQLRKFDPLLPNLQVISSMPGGSGLLSLLSANLLDLRIAPGGSEEIFPTVWTCLEALPGIAPGLQKLLTRTRLSQASLQSLSRLSNLRDLCLINPGIRDLSFFYSLSTLEHLESLTISDLEEPTSVLTPSTCTWTTRPYPALRELDISADTPTKFSLLFRIFKHHPLQRLELRHSGTLSDETDIPSAWPQVIHDISSKFYSLKSLTVLGPTGSPSPPSFSIFEPLMDMHEFESVHLDFPCLLFSNDDLHKLASAWPGLVTLHMTGSSGTPNATIEALEVFAVRCPKLHELSLPFDARQLPNMNDLPVSFSKLKTLGVQYSPIDNALFVARHLDRIFPNLKTIRSTLNDRVWYEVGDLLKTFKDVRMDQKFRDFEVMKRARLARRISTIE